MAELNEGRSSRNWHSTARASLRICSLTRKGKRHMVVLAGNRRGMSGDCRPYSYLRSTWPAEQTPRSPRFCSPLANCTLPIGESGYKRNSNVQQRRRFGSQFSDYLLISVCCLRNFPFGSTSKADSSPFVLTTTS